MSKHTPGPWVVSSDSTRILTNEYGPDYEIANCDGMASGHPAPKEFQIANAKLIATAPKLLETLKMARNVVLGYLGVAPSHMLKGLGTKLIEIDDVIAKAEGEEI